MSDLRPCPFCGGKAELQTCQRKYEFIPTVECVNCCANAPILADDSCREITLNMAIEAWGTRAADAQVEKMVGLLRYIYSNHTKPGSDADARITAALAAYDAEKQK